MQFGLLLFTANDRRVDVTKQSKSSRELGQEFDEPVRRFPPMVSNDGIAGVLTSRAMLVQLRSTNVEEAIRRMRFSVDALEESWGSAKKIVG